MKELIEEALLPSPSAVASNPVSSQAEPSCGTENPNEHDAERAVSEQVAPIPDSEIAKDPIPLRNGASESADATRLSASSWLS